VEFELKLLQEGKNEGSENKLNCLTGKRNEKRGTTNQKQGATRESTSVFPGREGQERGEHSRYSVWGGRKWWVTQTQGKGISPENGGEFAGQRFLRGAIPKKNRLRIRNWGQNAQ